MIEEYRLPRTISHSVHCFRECLVRLSVTLSRSVVVVDSCMHIYVSLSGIIQLKIDVVVIVVVGRSSF